MQGARSRSAARRAETTGGRALVPVARGRQDNLPAALTGLVGRARDVAALTARLAEARLLTLTGVGGVGKSRLALEVARAVRDRSVTEVWLVELAGVVEPSDVSSAVAAAVGAHDSGGRPLVETLIGRLADRDVLLVLDNCEHLIDAAAELTLTLLHACPNVRALTTSTEPLGISGEVVWRVEPLAVPDPGHLPPRSTLMRFSAVHLFVERARAARADFALTERNAEDVARICTQLDGVPLAIELAAARVAAFTPGEILARLSDRFAFLAVPDRTAPPRHRALLHSVTWSHDLLSEWERIVFRRMSVFRGGWTLAAAERVASCELRVARGEGAMNCAPTEDRPVGAQFIAPADLVNSPLTTRNSLLDALASLVARSLVTAREQDGETRYSFLETIRQYARDRLREAGEEAGVFRRHRDWCVELAEAAEPHLRGPDQIAWLARLEREHENLSAALGRCVGRGEAEPGLRLCLALWHFWNDRGYTHEGYSWLRRLLALDSAQAPTALRGAALFLAAKLAFEEGDLVTAQALGAESLEIARAVDDRPTLHRALTQLGHIARGRGEWLAARTYYEEALPIRREIGEPADVAVSLAGLGHVARTVREYAEAEALYRESLELARSQGHASDVTAGQHHLGRLAHERGDDDEAAAWYAEALPVAQQINHPRRIAYLLEAFAALAARRQPERALRLAGAADALRRTSGSLLPPSDRADLDRELAPARRLLGERRSEAVWAAGGALSVDDAIAEALAPTAGRPRSPSASAGGRLSERERQVAALVARGLSNREIAAKLALRERTVANHLQRIYARLGLAGRVQLTTWAFEHGLAAATTIGIIAAQQIGQF